MKIEEARSLYNTQILAYHERQLELAKQKEELERKIKTTQNGSEVYANEAAVLELTTQAVDEKLSEYQKYMEKLMEQWSGIANMVSSKQQGEAMSEYVEDIGKILEVARRIMKGGIVPPSDEKKLMDYSMEMYQAAKNIGAMMRKKEREEYDSLWDDEEEKEYDDPIETADNAEAFADGPQIVDVAEMG